MTLFYKIIRGMPNKCDYGDCREGAERYLKFSVEIIVTIKLIGMI